MRGYTKVTYIYQGDVTTKARLLILGSYYGDLLRLWFPKDYTRSYHPDSNMIRIADWLVVANLKKLTGGHRELFLKCLQEGDWQ